MDEQFTIDTDGKAEWALEQIAETKKERDRLISLAEEKITELEEKIQKIKDRAANDTSYLETLLYNYFMSVERKKTKTTEKYKLLSGELVLKKKSPSAEYQEDKLIEYLKANQRAEYIETKEKLKWGEFKKNLDLSGDKAIDRDTGEIIDCIKLIPQADEFTVEV